jgi:23S rRNA pseudouridine1911/1915/1917 synthase
VAALKDGLVSIDGRTALKPSERLRAGATVTIRFPPPPASQAEPEPIPLDIVYEDGDVIVLNKPPGLVVHPAAGHLRGTLVNALLHHAGKLPGEPGRPGIVHRLDKDTSGLMVVAKTDRARQVLQAMLKRHEVVRDYVAVVRGPVEPPEDLIDLPIGRDPRRRLSFAVVPDGKPARTHYRVLRNGAEAVLVLRLETGRTHQIRVHLAFRGWPVVGDTLYGGGRGGQLLHAARLAFRHPVDLRPLDFFAPPPPAMAERLRALGVDPEDETTLRFAP